jgi:nicotinate-nucleotide adenylyltransferase
MKLALFGGTFDPVHRGHLAIAGAAAKQFGLSCVYFVPADLPPHKQHRDLTPFHHRYAMLALATQNDRRFVPSLLDAGASQPNYSINTVRRLKQTLKQSDRLYFLIGIDAFMEISTWYHPVELLTECDFIVVSRPGYSLADIGSALPEALRPAESVIKKLRMRKTGGEIALPSTTVHLLGNVNEKISSTQIRAAAQKSYKELGRYLPSAVAGYAKKEHLYMPELPEREKEGAAANKVLSFRRGTQKSPKQR